MLYSLGEHKQPGCEDPPHSKRVLLSDQNRTVDLPGESY